MDITTLAMANKIGNIAGEHGKKYKIVACVIRNDGSGWKQITNPSQHSPINVSSITNDTSGITINYSFTAKNVVSFVACPDETMATQGYSMGASVGTSSSVIVIGRTKPLGGYVYYDGTNWNISNAEGVTAASFSAGVLTLTHTPITGVLGLANCREAYYIAGVGGLGSTTTQIMIKNYTGALVTTPDTNMKIYFQRVSNSVGINPNDYTNSGGNIWCYGIFEV